MNLKNALVKKLYKHPRVILGIILGITLFLRCSFRVSDLIIIIFVLYRKAILHE